MDSGLPGLNGYQLGVFGARMYTDAAFALLWHQDAGFK